ncbi:Major Facilitator Superfamily/Sugar transporter family [Novymonas esmeraldas]|uniref:Major Facilitator Superfamily/Sugar transporter family n=1 Tax=Novymonas esmeraldas TaxID=1808958 RepID=A0AAW0EPW7_9TRYP
MQAQRGASGPAPATAEAEGEPPPAVTPLPMKQMAALTVVLLTESIGGTMLLPFVPRLIADLLSITVEEAGYYSGILVGLFMLGQVVSSKLWGFVSDRYGRKLPLATGLLAGAVAMFFFGYTRSFVACCVLRFLHGIFNGNVLVAKTMIADITDRTNQAKGFALLSITFGVGSLFGPFIGGFLYNPSSKTYLAWLAGGSLRDFFDTYPAFLPSLVICLYTLVSLAACVVVLKESNTHRIRFRDTLLGRTLQQWRGRLAAPSSPAHRGGDVVIVPGVELGSPKATADGAPDAAATPAAAPRYTLTYMGAMRIVALRNITMFYMLLSASDMTFAEILPLWGNAQRRYSGMGLTENTVAVLLLSYSIPSVIANLYFHHVCVCFDNRYIVFLRSALAVYTACTLAIPLGSQMRLTAGYLYVMLLGMGRQIGLSWGYSLIHMLTATTAPVGCVGAAYGISQSMAAATRCVVPFVVAPLFAWSLREGHVFPFNYYLVFLVSAVPTATAVCMSFYFDITRSEDSAESEDSAGEADVVVHDGAKATVLPSHRPPCSGADGGERERVDRDSAYASLVASFCSNPLHDAYVDVSEMERENTLLARERQHRCAAAVAAPVAIATVSAPRTPVVSPRAPLMAEQRRCVVAVDEEELLPPLPPLPPLAPPPR